MPTGKIVGAIIDSCYILWSVGYTIYDAIIKSVLF